MMLKISKRCPICRASGRKHNTPSHLFSLDMMKWQQRVNDERFRWGLPEIDIVG
jgi:hypothetical protein